MTYDGSQLSDAFRADPAWSVPGDAGPIAPAVSVAKGPDAKWIALSDHAAPIEGQGIADVVQCGSLVVELTEPSQSGTVLLDYQSEVGWPRGLSIFHHAQTGIILMHRQGGTVTRHHLPGPLPQGWGLARLIFAWDGPARTWSLTLEDAEGRWAVGATGTKPMPLTGKDIRALCAGGSAVQRHAAVDWFGVSLQPPGLPPAAWVGHRTPIDTRRGLVAAGELGPDDLVATLDGGYLPLLALHRMTLPNRGRFSPVLLRAPYFAERADLLVAPGQLTLLSGAAVEYLFGEDAVLAPAAALRDGNTALSDTRRPLTTCIALALGQPALILADGCPLLCCAGGALPDLPYRLLRNYELRPLISLLRPGEHRSIA